MPYLAGLGAFLAITMMLIGCDNTIQPFDEETGLFSVYGYLSLSGDPNVIRIRDLNNPLTQDSTQALDATVMLENLEDNTTEVLQERLVELEGMYVHNFEVTMPITPETPYRLTVERADGERSRTTATTPSIEEVEAFPEGGRCETPITVTFHNVENPALLRASVGFSWEGNDFETLWQADRGDQDAVVLEFSPSDIIWQTLCVDLPDELEETGADLPCFRSPPNRCYDLDEEHLYVEYYNLGPEWLEYDVPVNPLESFDVEDGLGFFGALREKAFSISIDTTAFEEED